MIQPANTLPDDISQLKAIITDQILSSQKYEQEVHFYREELEQRKTQIERLTEVIRLLRHHRFGRKSEIVKNENQFELFNEVEELAKSDDETESGKSPSIEVKAHRRRGNSKRVKFPSNLPREEIIIDLTKEEKICPEGHELKCIGEDVSEQLNVIPAQIVVIRTIRKKYACPKCEGHVKRAPLPKTAIPKSMAAPGLLAHIATSKYGDGLPLYRQEHMWKRLGVDIPRVTMAAWMIKVGDLLTPLINLMEEDLLDGGYVQADETRVQVLNEPGKAATSLSYMWVRGRKYHGAPPIVIFEYDPTRGGDVAKRLFKGYSGYLQADAYGGYNGICREDGITRVGCMAHVRRKFFEAAKASKKGVGLANEAIEIIRRLYEVENGIKDADIEERYKVRSESSRPILDEFRIWLDDHLREVPPKSQIGAALSYTHNEWVHLVKYLDDGRLYIDNNFVENAIRPFALGRKNWLFSDSVNGAKASAAIYSIMISAKQNGHNEYTYLRHILEKLPLAEKTEDFEALLPHRLKPQDVTPTPGQTHLNFL